MTLTVGSLFSGIGGLDLGLERAGMEVRWQVEQDAWCQRVLAKHWPNVIRYGDIKTIDWTEVEPVDLICGGFPCQPVSLAGKRLAQEDERWLWPEFARCLRVLRPRFALVENVPGLLSAGMGDVLGDLAALGYDAEWDCIPAAAVGAPHQRYRVVLVAYPERDIRGASRDDRSQPLDRGGSFLAHPQVFAQRPGLRPDESGGERRGRSGDGGGERDVPDADRERCEEQRIGVTAAAEHATTECGGWWATEPEFRRVADGISPELDGTGMNHWANGECHGVPRVATGVPNRVDRLRGLGNAVVPQVAEWVGRRIVEIQTLEEES
jgi:DNA (cytosine-5)-methyltransferase 1